MCEDYPEYELDDLDILDSMVFDLDDESEDIPIGILGLNDEYLDSCDSDRFIEEELYDDPGDVFLPEDFSDGNYVEGGEGIDFDF